MSAQPFISSQDQASLAEETRSNDLCFLIGPGQDISGILWRGVLAINGTAGRGSGTGLLFRRVTHTTLCEGSEKIWESRGVAETQKVESKISDEGKEMVGEERSKIKRNTLLWQNQPRILEGCQMVGSQEASHMHITLEAIQDVIFD